jgi:A/G-specific adenine glycosylase
MKRTRSRTVKKTARSPRITTAKRHRLAAIAALAATLYRERGREFPWRSESDPYRLAVAEILLQKTRAESVVTTYGALLRRYPDVNALAAAEFHDLESALRRLGLSRKRATQMKAMASAAAAFGREEFSDWRRVLSDVPGLGTYAARAISCFACGEVVGIVDANVARILRRVFALRTEDPRAVVFQKYADDIAASAQDVRSTNFGLLDIGALICTTKPKCGQCPLVAVCAFGKRRMGAMKAEERAPAKPQSDPI